MLVEIHRIEHHGRPFFFIIRPPITRFPRHLLGFTWCEDETIDTSSHAPHIRMVVMGKK